MRVCGGNGLRDSEYYLSSTRASPTESTVGRAAAETDKKRHIDINVHYSADDGVIHISASLFDLQSSREQMEAGCRRVLTMIRINVSKGLGGLFSHVDHSFRPSANGQAADLFGMIDLACHVYGGSTTDRRFSGAMPLRLGEEMEVLSDDR